MNGPPKPLTLSISPSPSGAEAAARNGFLKEAPGEHPAVGHRHRLHYHHLLLAVFPAGADPIDREPPDDPPGLLRPPRRLPRLPGSPPAVAGQPLLPGPAPPLPPLASASGPLFHVPLRRILRFRLPCTYPSSLTEFYSFGCRVAIHDRDGYGTLRELRIRHLLTSERARLPDPPERCYSEEVVFSGDLVITFMKLSRVLYYCHIGDAHWREARCDLGHMLYDLMFVKGTLYALIYSHPHYRLAVVELDKNSSALSFLGDKLSVSEDNCPRFWLAEGGGELWLVVRVEFNPWVYHVICRQSGEMKWTRTTSLGGCSLFFNCHEFAGCLGPDHPGVRRDCLYFTGYSGKWSEYSLVDGSYHEFVIDHPGRTEDYGSPVWVLPSIY